MINNAPLLKVGAKGVYVNVIETLLNTLTDDGEYKADEKQHVMTYQAAHNLEVDGVVGPKTYKELFGVTKTTVVPTPSQDEDLNPEPITPGKIVKPVDYK